MNPKVHYAIGYNPICGTNRKKKVLLTTFDKEKVTCKICLKYLDD